jgi:hypothetical protein
LELDAGLERDAGLQQGSFETPAEYNVMTIALQFTEKISS